MADELKEAVKQIQKVAVDVTGVRYAPQFPPENPAHWPLVVTIPQSGTILWHDTTTNRAVHNVQTIVAVARKDAPRDVERLLGFGDSIPTELLKTGNFQLSNKIDNFTSVDYTFGPINDYAGLQLVGWIFTLGIKIRTNAGR